MIVIPRSVPHTPLCRAQRTSPNGCKMFSRATISQPSSGSREEIASRQRKGAGSTDAPCFPSSARNPLARREPALTIRTRTRLAALFTFLLALTLHTARAIGANEASARVATGIDVLELDHFRELAALAGKHGGRLRMGLLTNQTGRDRRGQRTAEILEDQAKTAVPGAALTMLFSPEHGINGVLDTEGIGNSDRQRHWLARYQPLRTDRPRAPSRARYPAPTRCRGDRLTRRRCPLLHL